VSSTEAFQRGRTASAEQLRLHLMTAPEEFVSGAARNPAMGIREWTALLRNSAAPEAVLKAVGADRGLTGNYVVRRLLVQHPRTPLAVSRRFLPFLFWKDLLELTLTPSAQPAIQRQAEQMLRGRLAEMGLGERISLARRAGRALVPALVESRDDRVLQALLTNPRLTEADVARIAERPATPVGTLAHLALHHRWSTCRRVRLALIANRSTPRHAALALTARLDRRDLQQVADSDNVPRFVRMGANRHLQRMSGASPTARPGSP
jgi:hypothetical protein